MAFPGGACPFDEFGIRSRRPRIVVVAVGGPPFGKPRPGIWEGAFEHLQTRDPPGTTDGGEDAAPGGDAAFLFTGVEEHERGMREADDRGEGVLVRVVNHRCSGLWVHILPQRGGVTGEGECARWARFDDAAAIQQLPDADPPYPSESNRHPLDEFPAPSWHPREHGCKQPDRCGVSDEDAATGIQRSNDREDTHGEGDQLRKRQPQQDAASGEPGEFHRRQFVVVPAAVVFVFACHNGLLLRLRGRRRCRWWCPLRRWRGRRR